MPPMVRLQDKQIMALHPGPWGDLDEWEQAEFLKENRFPHILVTIIEEGFWLQHRLGHLGETVTLTLPNGFEAIPEQILADVRVLLWWDDENADLDLWIQEPGNVEASFRNKKTVNGGRILDQVKGLGPEPYRIEKAISGDYRIQTKFYGTQFSQLMGPIYVKTELWTRFGHPDEAYRVQLTRIDKPDKSSMIQLEELTWPLL